MCARWLAWTMLTILTFYVCPSLGWAASPALRKTTFFEFALAPGQTISFKGAQDTLFVRSGETAAWRYTDGTLLLSNGTDSATVRPLRPFTPQPIPHEQIVDTLNRSYGARVPRIRELLSDLSVLDEALQSNPALGEIRASLPTHLDANSKYVRFAAYRVWEEETASLERKAAIAFQAHAATGDLDGAAHQAARILQASPLTTPNSVRVEATLSPDDGTRTILYTYLGEPTDRDGHTSDIALTLPADALCEDEQAPTSVLPDVITREQALQFHHTVYLLLADGRKGTLELGSGWMFTAGGI